MPETFASDHSFSTSTSLLSRVQLQEALAWDRFAEIYTPLVFSWVRSAGLQTADTADLVQEVFCVVAKRIHSYRNDDPNTKFRSWLWGITRNILRRFYQTNGKNPMAKGGSSVYQVLANSPEILESEDAPSSPGEEKALIYRAMMAVKDDFEEKTWEAFWRMAVENQSAADVARDLDMKTNAVRQAKYRVLCRMRDELID